MNKRVLVTGANGQLGRSIQNSAPDYVELEFTFVTRDELDLSRTKFIDDYFQDKEYDVVINCAAYTAVDKAEEESALAEQINHFAVKRLAEICKVTNTSFVHISTDYVFDGKSYRPYIETDVPNPENIYGKTKLAGELAVQEINPNGLIIRTSWVYSEYGSNFVKTMLRLGETKNSLSVVYDQIGSPTYARDLAEAILSIIQRNRLDAEEDGIGVYHYSNEGVTSWFDFSRAIFDMRGLGCSVLPVAADHYPSVAKRPYYSVFNKEKVRQEFDLSIPYWRDSLRKCLEVIIKS